MLAENQVDKSTHDPKNLTDCLLPQLAKIGFTNRELDVFCLLLEGKSNKEIGLDLCISEKTVEKYLTKIYSKLGVTNRTKAICCVMRGAKSRGSPT